MRRCHVIIQFAIFLVDERGFVCKRLLNSFFLVSIVHRIRLINVMDAKKNLNRRTKRSKGAEENYWDCSVCTYRNTAEAFKCLMCDVRKGTSTRKPRFNPQLVAQQVAQQYPQSQPKQKSSSSKPERDKKSSGDKAAKKIRPRLKNVDRSSAQQKAVTVNNVTVIITEFQPKRRMSSDTTANGPQSSSGNSTDSSQSDSASHSEAQNGDSQSDRR